MTGWKHLDFWRIESTCFNYLIKVPPTLTQPQLNFTHFSTIFNFCRPLSTAVDFLPSAVNPLPPVDLLQLPSTLATPVDSSQTFILLTFLNFLNFRRLFSTSLNHGHFGQFGSFLYKRLLLLTPVDFAAFCWLSASSSTVGASLHHCATASFRLFQCCHGTSTTMSRLWDLVWIC